MSHGLWDKWDPYLKRNEDRGVLAAPERFGASRRKSARSSGGPRDRPRGRPWGRPWGRTPTSERYVRMIELRYFAGLGLEETADVLGVSRTIIVREWAKARAFLETALESPE